MVISKIKERILTSENLTKLVNLVNEEMDIASSGYRDEIDTVIAEIGGVEQRLGNLYNAIENGNIEFHLLKPRLKEFRDQHDRLLSRKAELEMILSQRQIELAGPEIVRKYVEDLRQFIDGSELSERRSFIKGFVEEVKVVGNDGLIRYTFPIPPDNRDEEGLGVLPIVRYGGRYRT